ncbi:MAG TPA: hypothetical protein EYQ73_07445 [Candidatus Poseidoniales archaeon]|jgi:hypothetical protein|nr:MAG: hypothetical protein CXT71_06925 [Euryarchaeota archaeon]HIF46604.1 hypothetical protein [Candidatus Poseidoniales archaeon]HIL65729.1 hypothetical protein [Candidatus Poseidoniales archaeon]
MKQPRTSWNILLLALLLPILLLVAINITIGNAHSTETFKRFGNALLTSFIIMGILLLGNLIAYADSRHRPAAPLVGMLAAITVGILLTVALVSYSDLLLESNSGVRSQILSNIVRLLVSGSAMAIAGVLAVGLTFAAITGRPRRVLFYEEE